MKRLIKLLCCLMILVILPLTAQAGYIVDETTFNKTCEWRMSSSSTLYKGTAQDTDQGVVYTFEPIGTLSAGKYVVPLYTENGKTEVFYWNGGRKCAWVDSGTISSASRTIYATNGNRGHVPTLAWGDEDAVRYFLSEYWSPEDVQSFIDGMKQGLTGEKDENGQIVIVKKEPLTPPEITLRQEDGELVKVDMVLPGVARSTVKLGDAERILSTADLQWELGDAEQALATIHAPRSGLASLYARDDGKGGVIKKLKAGSVVLVLGESGKYTKVYGENTVGYVITSALKFHDPCTGASEVTVTSRTNLCLNAEGRKLIDLPAGATVLLIKRNNNWSQVEYEGFVGFMETRKMRE